MKTCQTSNRLSAPSVPFWLGREATSHICDTGNQLLQTKILFLKLPHVLVLKDKPRHISCAMYRTWLQKVLVYGSPHQLGLLQCKNNLLFSEL